MRDELLALLEEQPYRTDDLAGWLVQPSIVVAHTLRAMQREGLVKTVGTMKRWALVSYVAVSGRRPADRTACQQAILAALQGHALQLHEIVTTTNYCRTLVKRELAGLLVAGAVQHSGRSRASRWSLPGGSASPPVKGHARPPKGRPEAGAQALDDIEDQEEDEDALTLADVEPTEEDLALAETARPAGRPKRARAIKSDGVVPWWMTDEAKKDFSAAARKRDAAMQTDKEWTKRTTPRNTLR